VIRDDAALDEVLDALEKAEALARRAAHALSEAEEAVEENATSRAEVDACRARLEAAETLVAELRRRRQAAENALDWYEVLRVHARRVNG
jgi:exonuclease VII small subunit